MAGGKRCFIKSVEEDVKRKGLSVASRKVKDSEETARGGGSGPGGTVNDQPEMGVCKKGAGKGLPSKEKRCPESKGDSLGPRTLSPLREGGKP